MIGITKEDRQRITVKIRNNMKRSSDRDTPPSRSKRSRSSIGRYDDSSDERMTPDRDRDRVRGGGGPGPGRRGSRAGSRGRSTSPRRYPSDGAHRDRDDYRGRDDRTYSSYKVLCVSALHPKASDEVVKDTLYREYKKFGDISIRISRDLDERVAYVCFRSSEDARDAKHAKPRIIIYDKVAVVEAVYETSRGSDVYRRPTSRGRSRSVSPEYDRYYQRSPPPERHRPGDQRYDRYGPPPGMQHREFRRDGPPPHDFMRPPVHHGPPPHMPPGPPHHYGPPRHMMHGGFKPPGGPGGPHFDKMDPKKDKFPNYLQHLPPEDDPLATRTLFAGNLEINISDDELRRIFGRYGVVEDIDIKRPPPGTGNAYAFVRFQNLDMAHRAKVELSGQYIGKFQCKIGYGKATPTTRIWVGGLGPWISIPQLEREFDRFGAIKKTDYVKGENQAYILYDSIDAAQAAVKEMRGFPLGGPDRRLRIDFADAGPNFGFKQRPPFPPEDAASGGDFRPRPPGREDFPYDAPYDGPYEGGDFGNYSGPPRGFRGRGGMPWHDRRGGGRGGFRGGPAAFPPDGYVRNEDPEWNSRRPPPDAEYDGAGRRPSVGDGGGDRSRSNSPRRHSAGSDSGSERGRNGLMGSAHSLPELARKCSTLWQGALILKNSLFPAKFHLTDGDTDIIDGLMKDEDGKHMLRITQRLRLDPPKLEDVSKRISSSLSHAIFLGLAGSSASVSNDDSTVQTRPLRNLVSYLKQKEAAGVISLLNKDTEATGVLYAFPPCSFSTDLLKRTAPNLTEESLKEDHLVIVVVRGGSA
ncbi:RNA-binding protein spenito [Frankliniella fusca]|uniref:RNA-binding protein spenito n=1 Tax=Frankliniella fusca TaxID=407009 RepID=A0AAE1HU38_9NEOP|nr:RNA-binding protein spenito [Frankliniella fusca]